MHGRLERRPKLLQCVGPSFCGSVLAAQVLWASCDRQARLVPAVLPWGNMRILRYAHSLWIIVNHFPASHFNLFGHITLNSKFTEGPSVVWRSMLAKRPDRHFVGSSVMTPKPEAQRSEPQRFGCRHQSLPRVPAHHVSPGCGRAMAPATRHYWRR